ncbi:MAG TPA: hypothetical protein VGH38_29150 [Bryobacteraceae bacterium]|jgi:hypothetical protein
MKSGRVINGTYLGGTARTVKVEVNDRIETLDISDVARIEFRGPASAVQNDDNRPVLRRNPSSDSDDRPTLRRSDSTDDSGDRPVLRRSDGSSSGSSGPILRPDPTPAPASNPAPRATVELPAGTNIVVRMIDGVDSENAKVGQTFSASIDEQVMGPNGDVAIPRGADAVVKLVDAKESGKLTGRAELTLDLMSVKVDGRAVDINTQTVSRESSSRGERTAKVAGGTAAVGAIIGAIAGGGKGAVIGGAAGGAAGAGAEVATKGQRVKIPSETRLTFVLDSPLRI